MESDPVSPIDQDAAIRMWQAYSAAHPEAVAASPEYTVEHFGDTQRLADELLSLVLSGRKRATSELVADFLARGDAVPRIGSHWIACDGAGAPRVKKTRSFSNGSRWFGRPSTPTRSADRPGALPC